MLDAQNAPAAPTVIHRADYAAPDWLVPDIALDFDLDPAKTRVRATLTVARNGAHDRPLRLDGDGLTPLVVRIDGEETAEWTLDGGVLVLPLLQDKAVIAPTKG